MLKNQRMQVCVIIMNKRSHRKTCSQVTVIFKDPNGNKIGRHYEVARVVFCTQALKEGSKFTSCSDTFDHC